MNGSETPDGSGRLTIEQQVDYWQERFFAEQDEKISLLNQLLVIRKVLQT